jgi:Holliday junction DNA helicase RuvA
MICRLKGTVLAEIEDRVILEVAGVGYEVILPPYQLRLLRSKHVPAEDPKARLVGREVEIHIYHHVPERKPVPVLFGFCSSEERRFFELLAGVSRFGPMAGARSMVVPVPEYASLIMTRDARGLSKLPGIGVGKADQIIAQLRAKVALFTMIPQEALPEEAPAAAEEFVLQAQIALEDLGYRPHEAEAMVRAAREQEPGASSVEELVAAVWAARRSRR